MASIRQTQRNNAAAIKLAASACDVLPETALAHKAQAWNLRGNILHELDQPAEALASYDRAISYRPDFPQPWRNRGDVLREVFRIDEAITSYDRAIGLDPNYVDAHLHRGLSYLLKGDYRRGFEGYEWRLRSARWNVKPRAEPRWTGREPIGGKTIMIQAEQGIGDMIQFVRFVRPVADLGAKIVFRVPKFLKHFFSDVDGASIVIGDNETLPPFDYQCPLMSVCLALGIERETIPTTPYLKADASLVDQRRQQLSGDRKFRVGLAWSGRSEYNHNLQRSMSLPTLGPLLALDHCSFYCIQTDVPANDVEPMRNMNLVDLGRDFPNTAAIIENLDLVISIDTSIAHLAGALGKPVWVMSAQPQKDWRYIPDQSATPWYPTMRLFWQSTPGDWGGVVDEVVAGIKSQFAFG
jgi:tetratricopeptide (TPR) repeat protein